MITTPKRTLTKTITARGVVAAMVLAVGTTGIGTNPANAADLHVPFLAQYFGHASFTNETSISFDGAGIATQLGHSSNHGDITLTGPDSSCPGGLANIHVDTLTAANGDSITISAHDVACPIGPLQFRGSGTWMVTAGTGRFSDATGAGVINGGANFATQEFSFVMSGTIAVP